MRFSTIEFEFAHGRRPRGYGHWAFELRAIGGLLLGKIQAPVGNYSEAKRWAVAQARQVGGVAEIRVLS